MTGPLSVTWMFNDSKAARFVDSRANTDGMLLLKACFLHATVHIQYSEDLPGPTNDIDFSKAEGLESMSYCHLKQLNQDA